MESLRNVRRKMEKEVKKGRAVPIKFEEIRLDKNSYKIISSIEQYKDVIECLLRLNKYHVSEEIVANNVYMNPMAKVLGFVRPKSAIERMNLSVDALKREKKFEMFYENNCIMEEAVCYFSLSDDKKEKCKYSIEGKTFFRFQMSNPYIMGLLCECESARANFSSEIKDSEDNPVYKKIMALKNVSGVMFQCILFDEAWEEDGMICAKLYTIFSINR